MLQLVKYDSGECRVIDTEKMIASDWLHHNELDAPLEDYDLDCDLSDEDLTTPHRVIRERA